MSQGGAQSQVAAANALAAAGRTAEAIRFYEQAVALSPRQVDWLCNLASLYAAVGRHTEAVAVAARALDVEPDCVTALYNQAVSLIQLGDPAAALVPLQRCARLTPDDPRVHNNLGLACAALRDFTGAVAAYDRALALNADYARALSNRGFAEIERHDYVRALVDLERAVALEPHYSPALVNRGIALAATGRKTAALESFRQAFPAPQALANAAAVLRDMERGAEAWELARQLYLSAPDLDEAAGIYHAMSQNFAAWSDYDARLAAIVAGVRAGRRPAHPFAFLNVLDSPPDQLRCARAFATSLAQATPLWQGEVYAHQRLRIAYLSSDFHDHATAYLAIGLFERHDRARFEVYALSYGPNATRDQMRDRLAHAFEHVVHVSGESAPQIAARVRALEIDILVDLKGYTDGTRIDVLAHRPAPVQVHYLGYPGTLGATCVDYLIADRNVIPPADRCHYAEHIVYLPHCYQVTDDRRSIDPEPWDRQRAGLPPEGPVLCAFHQIYKLNPPLFDVWMRLLERLPKATLWLLADDAGARASLRREAAARGVDAARLVFAQRLPQAVHLARLGLADVFLDTRPVGAHTTASDALWCGVPVVAFEGQAFAARVAASIVRAAGFPELVVGSFADYEALIHRLCAEPSQLLRLQAEVRRRAPQSALFDTAGFTRALESAYSMMAELYRSRRAPQPIEVPVPAREPERAPDGAGRD